MEIYKVEYQDRQYEDHEKLFVKLDKAKDYAKEIVNKELKLIEADKESRLFTHDEFINSVKSFTKDKDWFEKINVSYPIIKYKTKVFNDEIQTTRINYFYIQEDDGDIEEYEMTIDICVKKVFVED